MATDLTMTERAAHRIGEILKSEPSGAMLRLSVLGGGCSGFQYKFDVERDKANDDLVIARGGMICWWIRCRCNFWRARRSTSSMT